MFFIEAMNMSVCFLYFPNSESIFSEYNKKHLVNGFDTHLPQEIQQLISNMQHQDKQTRMSSRPKALA